MKTRKWFVNVAVSKDDMIARPGKRSNISSDEDWKAVHLMRNLSSAIVVGSNTILVDNPKLLVKAHYLPKTIRVQHPIRIIFDRRGRLDGSYTVFHEQDKSTTIWVTNSSKQISSIKKISFTSLQDTVTQINELLDELKKPGQVMVEGGSQLIQSFLNDNLISYMRIYRSNKPLLDGLPLFTKDQKRKLILDRTKQLGKGSEEYYSFV
ncbi:MAG: RibD family protein [Candidatus Kariarchaeaceae archaeon]|jgi:diaminohydroxyphosphoribosylaminopyrimidine deaminase/5-amino-6-(5-phosphoribosylamino)uracil reductase